MNRTILVLAAGKGTRMKSPLPKVLHPLLGRPMISHLLEALGELKRNVRTLVVIGHGANETRALCESFGAETILQQPQLGTGHALMCCEEALRTAGEGECFLTAGDAPLLPVAEVERLWERFSASGTQAAIVSMELPRPGGYGRIVRDGSGRLSRIVEARDASPEELAITEVNSGAYFFKSPIVFDYMRRLKRSNSQDEYYLTDLFEELSRHGKAAVIFSASEPNRWMGINSQAELAGATRLLRLEIIERWMAAGATIMDPAGTWIESGVKLEAGVVLHPFVRLCGSTHLGTSVEVRSFSTIIDCEIGSGSIVKENCVLEKTGTGKNCAIGPFSRTREGTELADEVRLGNFVETKKARLGDGVKAGHLSYLGDATVGAASNIGAGTITCNFDGRKKYPTILGEGVFIGSDTQLVAPVKVGDGAYVGAGTTVTKEVPPGALAISRVLQKNIPGWAVHREKK